MGESETIYFLPRLDTEIHIETEVDSKEARIFIKNKNQRFGTRYIRNLTDKEKSMDSQDVAEELIEDTLLVFDFIGRNFSKMMDTEFKKLNFKKN